MYACHSQSAFAFLIKVTNRFARFIFRLYTVLLSIRDLVAFVLSTYLSFGTRFFHLKGSLGPILSNPRINTERVNAGGWVAFVAAGGRASGEIRSPCGGVCVVAP